MQDAYIKADFYMTNLEQLITKYWGFVLFLLGLIFHAIWTYFQVSEHSKRLGKLEEEHSNTSSSVNELKDMVGRMEAKLDILVEGFNTKKK